MKKKPVRLDPYAAREAQTYERPIPSREYIMEVLAAADGPIDRHQLGVLLQLSDHEQIEALRRRLRAMERDAQLIRNRKGDYGLVDRMNLIRGRIQAHRDGFGFLIPDDGSDDIYLSNRQMSTVFHNDEVLCQISGYDRRGRPEGIIVELLKCHTQTVVGRLFATGDVYFVKPDNPRINHEIVVTGVDVSARQGQYVVVEITTAPGWRRPASGKIVEVLGDHMAPGLEIDIAIRSYGIPYQWSDAVKHEVSVWDEPKAYDRQGRVDLRHYPLVTIDGEDAQDFDDAVYCEVKKGGGWRLWVAIADVAHYVGIGSALDEEAHRRGNSVYFPEHVVPMLPESLSNGLCSLKPHVDRLCMTCEMTITAQGKLSSYRFYEAVMHSHARLTYTTVGVVLDPTHAEHDMLRERHVDLVPHLERLHQLYKQLREARQRRGAIDFDTVETRILFTPDRKIDAIVPVMRNDAHKLIEECMLCANVATARFLQNQAMPALYRVHEGPKQEKLAALRLYLGELGLRLGGGAKPKPEHYQVLLAQIAERSDASIIQVMVLRSLNQAVYQASNEGHFGLNYPAYAHFTSPIRRYPDLLVHRAIRAVIRSDRDTKQVRRVASVKMAEPGNWYPYDTTTMTAFGEYCSMTERRADDATRDVVAWLKCEYLQDHIGDQFDGVIAAVTSFGFFVELANIHMEGLVHVSSLGNDYYHFEPAHQRLLGERTRQCFQLGDEVAVRVAQVDLDDKKVDLEWLPGFKAAKKKKR